MAGLVADPAMVLYPLASGPQPKGASPISVTGLFYGNPVQLLYQIEAAAFIIVFNVIGTFVILKVIGLIVPLRATEDVMEAGDLAMHGMDPMPLVAPAGSRP
jgi:ammonium transporter, Amt family